MLVSQNNYNMKFDVCDNVFSLTPFSGTNNKIETLKKITNLLKYIATRTQRQKKKLIFCLSSDTLHWKNKCSKHEILTYLQVL